MLHALARERIRVARAERNLSLRELGRRIGLSASLLSQIETGKTDPSVSTLYALVSELDLSLDALLDQPVAVTVNAYGPVHGQGEPGRGTPSAVLRRSAGPVVTHVERRVLVMDSGVTWERLTRGPSDVDMLLVTYEAGGASSSTGKHMTHGGREFAYIIEGELTLELAFETHELRAGDSLEFDSSIPHLFHNDGNTPARGVWFVLGDRHEHEAVPPADADRAARTPPRSAVDVLQEFRKH